MWDRWDLFGENRAGAVRMSMGMSCPKEKSRARSGCYLGSAMMLGAKLGAGVGLRTELQVMLLPLLGPSTLRSSQPLHCNPVLGLWM